MRKLKLLHKLHGAARIVACTSDWPKWFREYVTKPRDGADDSYRMRSGVSLHTRRNGSDFHMIDEIWAFRKYDYFGYRVAPGEVVLDIGANIGTFSLYAAAACGASRVIAYEPFPDTFRVLYNNARESRVIHAVNAGVAGKSGPRDLLLDSIDPGSNSLYPETGRQSGAITIRCVSLADVFKSHGLGEVDFLKLDCEGAEYEILESAPDLIRRFKRVSMETHRIPGRTEADMVALFTRHGFKVQTYGESRLYATRMP